MTFWRVAIIFFCGVAVTLAGYYIGFGQGLPTWLPRPGAVADATPSDPIVDPGPDEPGEALPGLNPPPLDADLARLPPPGPPLRVTIAPSARSFEATCTIYAVANRSRRAIWLAVAPPRPSGAPGSGFHNSSGILVKPGETVAHETVPQDCSAFRGAFTQGGPPTPGAPGPFVKIEVVDCAIGDCTAIQY